jgi:hypothetical protein
MPCMCGALDCPSCGPARGYEVVRRWNGRLGRFEYVNPEDDDAPDDERDDDDDRDGGGVDTLRLAE